MSALDFVRKNGFSLALPAIAVLALLVTFLSGGLGMVEIQPGEAAVIYNTVTGAEQVIIDQGTLTFLPFFQKVQRVDVEPQVLTMDREVPGANANHDARLTVRAKDGSEFWFDELEIHYQIIGLMANVVMSRHGPGDAYKNAVRVHAREVLRDEFGRYTFMEAADPSSYQTATIQATQRLNERLNPTGIQISLIKTPRPRFDDDVENAINDRQTAQQEVRVQERERERLVKQRDRRVQAVRQSKNAELQSEKARLEAEFKGAQSQLVDAKTDADTYSIKRRADADAEKGEKMTQAEGIKTAAIERAGALVAEIEAVGAAGPGLLNRVIAEEIMPQLVQVNAAPYEHASHPIDIRHISADPQSAGN